MGIEEIISEAINLPHETEWIELKTNYWNPDGIGEYISALSNSAAMCGKKFGYMIWGIDNDNHQIVGTNIDFEQDIKNEPFKHYLARNLSPSINFEFDEEFIDDKRIILLTIPAAKDIPTEFSKERFIRIGSSKENLRRYPQREGKLWMILSRGLPSLTNTDSERQELTFEKLFMYYVIKGKTISKESFEKNLSLRNEASGKYNLLALLLSDDNAISVRLSMFNGTKKSDGLKSVKEFGNTCILYALDAVANYGKDVLNTPLTNETGRVLERKDVLLFDDDAYREAVINAFVHNDWQGLNAPQIAVFTDRIEIISHGTLAPEQTYDGFFRGLSVPVNPALAHILMQLNISDRSGKGVPTITNVYGKNSYTFDDNSITVTIPFRQLKSSKPNPKEAIISEIKANPDITANQLSDSLNMSVPMVAKYIRELKMDDCLIRVGSNKTGHWEYRDRYSKNLS